MGFKDVGLEGVDCINPAKYRVHCWALLYTVMNLRVP